MFRYFMWCLVFPPDTMHVASPEFVGSGLAVYKLNNKTTTKNNKTFFQN